MKTITFYSYKGGVGRTLALSNIAKRLAEFGKKVCIIDFDLEAPGLHHKFKENIKVKIKKGIVDYINFFETKKTTPENLFDYVTPLKFNNKKYKDIDFISAGDVFSDKYWKKLFSIDWINLFYKKESQGVALFVDLKERIEKELKPDYLLIDSRTGISEISGITMSLMADEIVLLSVKNEENLQGIKQIIKTLAQPENTLSGKLPKLNFVLCRIPYFDKPSEKIIEQRAVNEVKRNLIEFIEASKIPFEFEKLFVIHSDPTLEIEEKFLMGYKHDYNDFNKNTNSSLRDSKPVSPIATDYLELFEELTKDNLTEQDKLIFNNIKHSEFLLEKAKNIADINTKYEILMEVISLNPKSDEALFELAEYFFDKEDYINALNYIEKAIELNKNPFDYFVNKGVILIELKRLKDAENVFKNILKYDDKNKISLQLLGYISSIQNNPEQALEYFSIGSKFYPDDADFYNGTADVFKLQKKYESALEFIYKALELAPKESIFNATLAEIYAGLGNDFEFYKNFELALAFGMPKKNLKKIFEVEEVYRPFFKEQKFLNILKKYNIDIDVSQYL